MKYSILLLIFIIYSIFIFNISNYFILLIFFIINILISIILKIKVKVFLKNLIKTLPYIFFIIIINFIFSSVINSVLIGFRLFIVCNLTYLFSYILTPMRISNAISYWLYPLKIFKVDILQISLIISIAVSFIPVLIDESINIKNSLISKNFKFNLKNLFQKPHIFVITYIKNIFERIEEMEKVLKAKAYN